MFAHPSASEITSQAMQLPDNISGWIVEKELQFGSFYFDDDGGNVVKLFSRADVDSHFRD